MSPGHRNLIHADATPFLLVADTRWAPLFRATPSFAADVVEKWDAYGHPTGLHYSRFDTTIPDWAVGQEHLVMHGNQVNQAEPWLDFQWAQTRHHVVPTVI